MDVKTQKVTSRSLEFTQVIYNVVKQCIHGGTVYYQPCNQKSEVINWFEKLFRKPHIINLFVTTMRFIMLDKVY